MRGSNPGVRRIILKTELSPGDVLMLTAAVRTTAFRGDVHLTAEERERPSMVWDLLGARVPYWLIDAGGKFDFTVKWWATARWQAVVDALRGRVLFVQVGGAAHFHPRLSGVLDLRGLTTVRDLVSLMHHAEGVLCPITFPMHLAAAVERPAGREGIRPCVVVAGGREPLHWFSYPGHQVVHRVGALACCRETGCWKARTVPIGDRSRFDRAESLCESVDDVDQRAARVLLPVHGGRQGHVPSGLAQAGTGVRDATVPGGRYWWGLPSARFRRAMDLATPDPSEVVAGP